jgi:hypothetical protein
MASTCDFAKRPRPISPYSPCARHHFMSRTMSRLQPGRRGSEYRRANLTRHLRLSPTPAPDSRSRKSDVVDFDKVVGCRSTIQRTWPASTRTSQVSSTYRGCSAGLLPGSFERARQPNETVRAAPPSTAAVIAAVLRATRCGIGFLSDLAISSAWLAVRDSGGR